jgi:hypothetical protein
MARLVYLRIRRRLRPGTYARVERSPATATRAAFVVAAVAFTTSVLAQTGCASIHFQGAGQIPVLAPVETAARHPVGPWLTPLFGPEPAMIASWITAYPIESRLFVGTDPDSLEIQSGEVRAKLHRAILAGLEPGRRYWYAPDFGDGGHPGDRLYTFVAPDWSGHSAEILLLGDMQPRDAVSRRGGRLMARAVLLMDPTGLSTWQEPISPWWTASRMPERYPTARRPGSRMTWPQQQPAALATSSWSCTRPP